MLIKVSSKNKNPVHFWNYESFREIHNAKTKEHKTTGNITEFIIYEINQDQDIDYKQTDELGLRCQTINEINKNEVNKKW